MIWAPMVDGVVMADVGPLVMLASEIGEAKDMGVTMDSPRTSSSGDDVGLREKCCASLLPPAAMRSRSEYAPRRALWSLLVTSPTFWKSSPLRMYSS